MLARCSQSGGPLSGSQVPIAEARAGIDAANARMGEKGLRVLAFAARLRRRRRARRRWPSDPMSLTHDLAFVGMVGIIDPLRAEAKSAVQTALGAGHRRAHDHRRPRRHRRRRSARRSGSGPARSAAPSCRRCPTRSSSRRLPELHVFGRVTPQDKLRLARLMQEQGLIVAMTGDAVNDAAALKQADIGVAMGSGSEVTKQAARMILTDDNFGTLVHAVEIGRRVYDKVVSYVRYQMTQLLSLVMLFVAATAFDVNQGVALTPADGAVPALLRHRGRRRGDRRRPRRPGRDAPAAAGPEAADHQPRRGHALGPLRRRAVRRRLHPARARARTTRAPTCRRPR